MRQGRAPWVDCGLSAPPAVIARTWIAWCLAERGEFAEGQRHVEEGLALAEQMSSPTRS